MPNTPRFYTGNVIDNDLVLAGLLLTSVACVLWGIFTYLRTQKTVRILRGIIESRQEILLFYDDRDRLVFHSAGLVLFDKTSARAIRKLEHRPLPDREVKGELVIDGNRYRSRSKLLQYKPETVGTIIYLEYVGPETAKH
ncbi:MAG: hypothetical protein GY867_07730 [bacterium]|nr:hypothetical protein [bacterium]